MFAAVLVGAAVFAWFVVDARARRELETARTAFAAHGFPTRLVEIIPSPVPEEENADALLREAWRIASGSGDWHRSQLSGLFDELDQPEFAQITGSEGLDGIKPERLDRLEQLVGDPTFAAYEHAMYAATRRRHWIPEIDYTMGIRFHAPAPVPLMKCVRLLAKAAVIRAELLDDSESAWLDLIAAQTVARWMADQLTVLNLIAGQACRGMVTSATLHLLVAAGPPDDLDGLIANQSRAIATDTSDLVRALAAERMVYLDWLHREFIEKRGNWLHALNGAASFPTGTSRLEPWLAPVVSAVGRPRFARELRECYELNLEASVAFTKRPSIMLMQLRAVDERMDAAGMFLVQMIMTHFTSIGRAHLRHVARQRALVALLAAWRVQIHTGAWPANVEEIGLPPDATLDPCSGLPLIFRATLEEIIAYAPGFDRDDDGGREADASKGPSDDGDFVVRVRLAPEKAE